MEVGIGFKHTDVGVIPLEWGTSRLQDMVDRSHAISYGVLKPGDYVDDGIPLLQIQDVIHGDIDADRLHRISKQLDQQYSRTRLAGGEIVVSLVGTIGRVAIIPMWLAGGNLHRNLARVRVSRPHDPRFVFYFLNSDLAQAAIKLTTFGSTQALLNLADLRRLKTVVPPFSEQRAIAAVLGDVDALLGGLDRLIAKKRDLKRATMQQLLTGQIRLAGFQGEWEVKRLGEIAQLYQPETISQSAFTDYGYPVFGANGVVGMYARCNHKSPQITISCRGSCGTVNRTQGPAWITGNAMVVNLDANPDIDKAFVYYALTYSDLSVLVTGSGIPQIVRDPLAAFAISLPVDSAEQTAIAAVLSDMDAELAALEARRDKTRDLKRAMMYELLTGKTRLVRAGAAHA